jgi:signal recognition particle subunit SRP54
MFDNLSDRLSRAAKSLTGKGRISEDNVSSTVRQIRMALLEADVALAVVKDFVGAVQQRALGQEVVGNLDPGQAFVKIVHDELVTVLGGESATLSLRAQPPVMILLVGLQGAGKTTTTGKLAARLKAEGKRPLLASLDIYRPAAVEQLQKLAAEVGVDCFPTDPKTAPQAIAEAAQQAARQSGADVVLLDSAGRLHVDETMMAEAQAVHRAVDPHETLFVIDSMAGQDAVNAAKAFSDALPLTGVILTKADGDARGGVALSVRNVTGAPIKFLGVGEKLDALEPFHPERMASRILGMGDVLGLVEEVERSVDIKEAEKLTQKLKKGKGLDFEDLKAQLQQMLDMGGLGALLEKLPGLPSGAGMPQGMEDPQVRRQIGLINAMTPRERRFPKIIDGSRKRRIAKGAGLSVQDLNRLIKQQSQMTKMMKRMKRGGGLQGLMGQMGNLAPPGGPRRRR